MEITHQVILSHGQVRIACRRTQPILLSGLLLNVPGHKDFIYIICEFPILLSKPETWLLHIALSTVVLGASLKRALILPLRDQSPVATSGSLGVQGEVTALVTDIITDSSRDQQKLEAVIFF